MLNGNMVSILRVSMILILLVLKECSAYKWMERLNNVIMGC